MINPIDARIGQRVRAHRERCELHQGLVAQSMRERGHKWSQPTVAMVEAGQRPLRYSEAMSLRKVIGFDEPSLGLETSVLEQANVYKTRSRTSST